MIPFRRDRDEAGFPDLTPVLDMVFNLLIFFVIAAAFAVHGVDMRLPQASRARTFAGRSIEVILAADGSLTADGKPVTLRDLGFLVRRNAGGEGMVPGAEPRQILFKAEPEASVGDFVRTIDAVRAAGGERLVIASEPLHREAP